MWVSQQGINDIEDYTKDDIMLRYVEACSKEDHPAVTLNLLNKKVKEVYPELELKNTTRAGIQTYKWVRRVL